MHTLCPQADEQLIQMQHERDDLLRRVSEDQEDLNELMAKHKALIAQVGAGWCQLCSVPCLDGAWKTQAPSKCPSGVACTAGLLGSRRCSERKTQPQHPYLHLCLSVLS